MITHIPNTFNYGSAMMAVNLIYYLNIKFNGNVQFAVDTRTEDDFNNLVKCTGLKNIEVNSVLPDKAKLLLEGKDVKLDIDWINEYCDGIINYYDFFIVLGGDDLSEYYNIDHMINELYKLNKIAQAIPVFLIGQTIGPFTEWRIDYAAKMLDGLNIYTRDLTTYEYLIKVLNLNSDYIRKSSDLAFLKLPYQDEIDNKVLLSKFKLVKDKYVTLVPSGLGMSGDYYTADVKGYINNWIKVIKYIIDEKGLKVVLMPHVFRPDKFSDMLAINEIMRSIDKSYLEDIICISDMFFLPLKARVLLGNSKFTITGRMHPSISTFEMRKPSISISYSVKYKGIIGRDLKCDELIIESIDELWENDGMADKIIEKIEYTINNYDILINKIDKNVKKCEVEVYGMLDRVYNSMIKGNDLED